MKAISTFKKSSIALTVSALTIATPIHAQQNSDTSKAEQNNELEVISVTSSRRTKSLTEVPMAISAFNALTLERANVLDIEDIAGLTPGFTLSTYNPVTPQPYIRGVGTNSSSVGDDASVGVFIDDVFTGRAGGFRSDMFDIQRVEVLRGPQGSLYGRNVAGGAISVITKKPTEFYEAKLKATYGSYNLIQLQGMVSGAIAENVNGRFAGSIRQRDGWVDNIATGTELRDQDNQSFRGKLDFRLSDNTKLMVIADYSKDDLRSPGARTIKNYESVFGEAPTTGNAIDKVDLFNDGNTKREIYGISGNLSVEFSDMLFTSITAFREQDYAFDDDLFGRYFAASNISLTNDASENSKQITQEFRLQNLSSEPLEWTVGLYFFNEDIERVEAWDSSISYALQGSPELKSRPIWDAANETTSYALFGEGTYSINDHWSVTLGGRYTYDKKDFTNVATGGADLFGFLQENYQVAAEKSWNSFTPKLTANYFTDSNDMFYFTVSEGYKAGGYNGLAANKETAMTPFDQEKARNYEAGFKARLFDRKLTVNTAVFYLDYTDLQSFTTDLDTGDVRTATGDAEIKGIELDANARVGESLRLFATLALTDSEYTTFAQDPTVVGNSLTRTPEKSGSLGFNYQWLLADDQTLDLRTDLTYQSNVYYSVANEDAAAGKSHALVNANLTWESLEGWEVSAYVKNVTDKEYASHAFSQSGLSFVVEGEPRTFGVSATKLF
jgi:iron complex outermembrane receptor protein